MCQRALSGVAPAGSHLFCFGLGYSALALARLLAREGWTVSGTSRSAESAAALRALGFAADVFDRDHPLPAQALSGVTHILVSIPPDAAGDPVLDLHRDDIAALPGLAWLGYLSTTGVYGDRGGGWVDESSALVPSGERGRRRVSAERGWLDLWRNRDVPVHIFRLAAIYGPAAARLRHCAPALQNASTSRGRCFPAFMSTIWRACSRLRLPGRGRAPSTMSATTSRRRPRLSLPLRPSCWASRRRRLCRSRQPSCRRWRAAFTTTTSGSVTR